MEELITLENISKIQRIEGVSVVKRVRVLGYQNVPRYRLLEELFIQLSNKLTIRIPKNFEWDLSSVPRFLWSFLPPDGDFELASLIHDYLYIHRKEINRFFEEHHEEMGIPKVVITRKFADDEMLLWSKEVSGTRNKISMRNFDNQLRYIAVRLFGWTVWNKNKR